MFSLIQILVSAMVGTVLGAIVITLHARFTRSHVSAADTALIALSVGLSIVLWREAGNTQMLNVDPIPPVSPNDVLCPVVTYVCLGLRVAFRPIVGGPHWPRLSAILTLLSLLVNVVAI